MTAASPSSALEAKHDAHVNDPDFLTHTDKVEPSFRVSRSRDGLEALLEEHGYYVERPEARRFACCCGTQLPTETWKTDDAIDDHYAHIAAVVRAAGWVKGREEWGIKAPQDPEVYAPYDEMGSDWNEDYARSLAEQYKADTKLYRRTVTDWEEACSGLRVRAFRWLMRAAYRAATPTMRARLDEVAERGMQAYQEARVGR